jgi:class 3 adenylate cyclase
MVEIDPTASDIERIKALFDSCDLSGAKEEILKSLLQFETQTASFMSKPGLSAVVRWHKSLFLQKTRHYPRAEQLLHEALTELENRPEPIFDRWRLKACLSLGYVHEAQWNYIDAESYLSEACESAMSGPGLAKYLGEIYSLLSRVSLCLGRYSRSKRFVALEKEISFRNYSEKPADSTMANIYAHALVNYSRMTRAVGLVDARVQKDIEESIAIFDRLKNERGLFTARLEDAEFRFLTNDVDGALQSVQNLAPILKEKGMDREWMQAGLLAARIHRKLLEYEQAEKILNELIHRAEEIHLVHEPVMADAFFEMGAVQNEVNQETKALEYYRESAKQGMVLGIKNIIIRAFEAARSIDRYKARELLASDLVYEDALFVRNRMSRTISPFKESRSRAKLLASTLFVDIVDFSRMMKRSDEDMAVTMIDELIDRMYLIIYRHNGYIDKFLGDGFMAIFEHGFSLSTEVAIHAITAGMDIHRALDHKNRKLKKAYGSDKNIQVRIGISTGEIYALLLGNYIKTEFTYLGNSVNLASKLESRATEQFMLIDEQTNELTKEKVLSEPADTFIPGLGQTAAYRVLRLARMQER